MHTGGRNEVPDDHFNAWWYMIMNGPTWRGLPSEFGKWGTIYQFLSRLSLSGFFDFLEQHLICGNQSEAVFYDSTHLKVHQHANGPQGVDGKAVGTSRGGRNTKLHMAVDALGRLAAGIVLTAGNVSDHKAAPQLTAGLKDTAAVADKGYDSKKHRNQLRSQGCEPCIPARSNAKKPEAYDKILYRTRHCIENKFQRIKVFRRVVNRYEKTTRMFRMFIISSIAITYEKDRLWPSM